MQTNYLAFCLTLSIGFWSCQQSPKVVTPQYNESSEIFFQQLRSVGHFNNINIAHSYSQTDSDIHGVQLEIKLIDGLIRSYSGESLDSLASVVARIARNNITNWKTFDRVTIRFATSNGEPVSNASNKTVYVFRPAKEN